jgi:hypothetical protein
LPHEPLAASPPDPLAVLLCGGVNSLETQSCPGFGLRDEKACFIGWLQNRQFLQIELPPC